MPSDTLRRQAAAKKPRGRDFEALAERYLCARGLRLVERNFACRAGEIDLIMRDGDTLVFVEVRYRRSARFGGAAMSVTSRKQSRIVHAAGFYLLGHSQYGHLPCRFDVVAFDGDHTAPAIDWIAGAFSA